MSLLDTYRRNVQRKREEISRFQNDKAREQKKLADLSGKIQRASEALSRTISQNTAQSKLREIERYQRDSANVDKKIADIDSKIARKHKELTDEQKKVARGDDNEGSQGSSPSMTTCTFGPYLYLGLTIGKCHDILAI